MYALGVSTPKHGDITNASTRFATFGILDFFWFTILSGKFELNLHGSKRVMQALYVQPY